MSTVIIIGTTKVEILEIPKKFASRRFFSHNGMLYKVYPDAFRRMVTRVDDGEKLTDQPTEDSVVVFAENGIKPHNAGLVSYDPSRIVAEIHANKLAIMGKNGSISAKAGKNWSEIVDKLIPLAPIILVGIVLVWAIITG